MGAGLSYAWQKPWLKAAGICGLLGAATTFHAIYNLLVAYGGAVQYVAYAMPVFTMIAGRVILTVFLRTALTTEAAN